MNAIVTLKNRRLHRRKAGRAASFERIQRGARGLSLLEVLIVVMILGILAVIATANYLNALQLARQKRTMADMQAIGVAWEARAGDMKSYNAAGAAFAYPAAEIRYDELRPRLSPTYIRELPRLDAWGNPFDFAADEPIGGKGATSYSIRSRGRYGVVDPSYDSTRTTNFDCDIVFSAGTFAVYPEGVAQQ